jgi:hypothetical protein
MMIYGLLVFILKPKGGCMFQKKQRHILFYLALFINCHIIFSHEQAPAAAPMPTLHESSRDLGKAFVAFFNALGKQITEQAQELGTKISDYVDSIKSQNSKLFSIEKHTIENKIVITIKGFENVDASSCYDAHVSYNYQNVADKAVINVGPDAVVTISAYESPLVNKMITVSVVATIEKTEEIKQGDAVVSKTYQSKAQKNVSFSVEHHVNIDAIAIEFNAQNNALYFSMPFIEEQTKSVRVRVR